LRHDIVQSRDLGAALTRINASVNAADITGSDDSDLYFVHIIILPTRELFPPPLSPFLPPRTDPDANIPAGIFRRSPGRRNRSRQASLSYVRSAKFQVRDKAASNH